jgi:hypothetical protein
MNISFKKLLVTVSGLMLALQLHASNATVLVQANSMTNLLAGIPLTSGSVWVRSLTITGSNATSTVYIYDTVTNSTTWTNMQYTNYTYFPSNTVITWTNYYGFTNSITNVMLAKITNNVAANTNNWPLRIIASANVAVQPTVVYTPNVYFLDGIWATNVTTNIATVLLNYQQ